MLNRAALDELYAYTEFAFGRQALAVAKLGPDALTRPAPGSGWPALRDAYAHMIGAYDGWLHYTLKLGPMVRKPGDTLTTWDAVDAYYLAVRASFRRALDGADDAKLHERFDGVFDEDGITESMTLGEILANLLLHERGHHGDISTLFYQLGAEPPFVDYRMYVYAREHPGADLDALG